MGRRPMLPEERRAFIQQFWPGLLLCVLSYALITAARQFRDLFNRDIFTAANGGVAPSSAFFFFVDLPGGLFSGGTLFALGRIRDNRRALQIMLLTMAAYLVLTLLVTVAFLGG